MKIRTNGFTIVELLIVIVVIAILASITIVAYGGIQNRAKSTSAKTLATNVHKAVEIHYADTGVYPAIADLTNTSLVKFDSSSFTTSAAMPTTEKHVRYVQCGSPAQGAQIIYRTFPTGTADIVIGNCS